MGPSLRSVFQIYGGVRAIACSHYTKVAFFVTIMTWRKAFDFKWVEISRGVLPSVTGFSIAALALLFYIGDEDFRRKMTKVDGMRDGHSDLSVVMASIIWFIFVQSSAIVYSIIFESRPFPYICKYYANVRYCEQILYSINYVFSFFGLFITIYALVLIVATVMQMYYIFDLYISNERGKP